MKIIVITVWLLFSFAAMLFLGIKDIRAFDPSGELQFASTDVDFDLYVKDIFKTEFKHLDRSAFHIQDRNCSCSNLSERHVRSLNIKFKKAGYSVQTLTPQNYNKIMSLVPSLPALVVFDANGELAYLGPYSSGYFCGVKTSLIEPIVASITANTHLGALVISDSDGCYCEI